MLIWVCSFSTQLGLFNYHINLSPITREDVALLCANHELGGYGPLVLQDAGPLGANINSPWLWESPFRFLTYKYRFLWEGKQWNCHSKFPIELLAGS